MAAVLGMYKTDYHVIKLQFTTNNGAFASEVGTWAVCLGH
jgi:hypothetical protein